MRFPAFCPSCGLVFASAFAVEELSGATFKDVKQDCPRCGAWAELPDGTFNVIGDTIEVLAGSGLTHARMLRLQAILSRAASGETDSAQAVQAVMNEAPALKLLVQRYGPRMQAALIQFLLLLLGILIAQGISELRDDAATREDVRQAIEHALEAQQKR